MTSKVTGNVAGKHATRDAAGKFARSAPAPDPEPVPAPIPVPPPQPEPAAPPPAPDPEPAGRGPWFRRSLGDVIRGR